MERIALNEENVWNFPVFLREIGISPTFEAKLAIPYIIASLPADFPAFH